MANSTAYVKFHINCGVAVKPFVIIRKNALFAGSGIGSKSSCFLFTLIETEKANNLPTEDYLRYLFEHAPYSETTSDRNIEITLFQIRGEWIDLSNKN